MLPNPLFVRSYSTVVEDEKGVLLGARIAEDEQWRFPKADTIPVKFVQAITQFEDRYFFKHPGVNPLAIIRAIKDNLKSGKVVSGGSTLTMQLARLARKGKPRTIWQKIIEVCWALRIELRYTKKDILRLYAAHAPFGGNVVGLDAASWRYYRCPPHKLSWAEIAALAVLPNAPSAIFPGKKDTRLLQKRNRLLKRLLEEKIIDQTTYELSILEPVPKAAFQLPNHAPHLVDYLKKNNKGKRIRSSINISLQKQAATVINKHYSTLSYNHINNAAAIIAEVNTGRVLAYVGNVAGEGASNYVDICRSPRSSGSVLKPLLYAASLNNGMLLPHELLPDVPTNFGGFSPKNFDKNYMGAVPANEAIARSLNIPAVHLLHRYGVIPFYNLLNKVGFSTINRSPDNYGLSLILGGAEITLFDLCSVYASMGRTLSHFNEIDGSYFSNDIRPLSTDMKTLSSGKDYAQPVVTAWAIFKMFEAMENVTRPETERGWEAFASSKQIAWKTGTSFGFRDAWAVGLTSEYIVGVWVGNASGEGRPGLVGSQVAAPILFDLFRMLPEPMSTFVDPVSDSKTIEICTESGCLINSNCPKSRTEFVPFNQNLPFKQCTYHTLIHLDQDKKLRVSSDCYPVYKMHHKTYFVLPPLWRYFYVKNHPNYEHLPPVKQGCVSSQKNMELIYPRESDNIFIPVQLDGRRKGVVFKVAYQEDNGIVYWHLDDTYLGATSKFHEKEIYPVEGEHTLLLVNNRGEELEKKFVLYGE